MAPESCPWRGLQVAEGNTGVCEEECTEEAGRGEPLYGDREQHLRVWTLWGMGKPLQNYAGSPLSENEGERAHCQW